MRLFWLGIVWVLSCLQAGAQQINVSEDIILRNDIAYEIIGKLGGQTLLFRNQAATFEVQAFNDRMHESWTKELVLDRRNPRVLSLISSPDDFTLLYLFRQGNETILKAHKYNPAANLVDSITIKNLGYLFYSPRFQVTYSEDRSKALAYYIDQQNIMRIFSFDVAQMALLWEKNLAIDSPYDNTDYLQALVDNNGRMYYIRDRDNYRLRADEHYFDFFTYDGVGETVVYRIDMKDKFTYDVFFSVDNLNNRLVGAGFYSDRDNVNADGYFYLSIPPVLPQKYELTFTPFDNEFLSALLGREFKNNRGLQDVAAQGVVLRRDGGVLLIAERFRLLERRGPTTRAMNDGALRLMIDYYYDEILTVSINPDGKLHWQAILHKKQYSQDDEGIYSSYFMMKTPGQLRFLFNDEIRYENTVSEYVISGLGDRDRHSLFSTEKLDLRLRFRAATQISATEVIIPSEKRNRLKLVRLSY